MLTGGTDTFYRQALPTSHQPYLLVEVLDGFGNVLAPIEFDTFNPFPGADGLVYLAGRVNASLTSRVSRTCTLVLDERYYPYNPTDPLAPYGNMIRAWRGVEFADGRRYRWIVFIGRIQETRLGGDGTCQVYAADFAADVIENKFIVPQNSQAGVPVSTEVMRLISEGFSSAQFAGFAVDDLPVQPMTWQLERGQALDELSTSIGAFWYALADGTFTLRTYPWTIPSEPVVTYSDGDGGSVSESTAVRSREGVYNVLTVTGERLNGDTPVYATASDGNPASITYVNGGFGVRSQLLRLQTPGSQASAQAAANDNLRRLAALVDTWQWDMSPDAALELGDTVSLNVRGRSDIIQVVAGYTIPLDLSGPMRVTGRSRVTEVLEGVE